MYSYCQGVPTKVVFNLSLKILSVNVGLIWKATEVARWPVVCLGSSTVSPSVGQQQSRDQYQDTAAAAAPMYHSPVCQLAAIPPTKLTQTLCAMYIVITIRWWNIIPSTAGILTQFLPICNDMLLCNTNWLVWDFFIAFGIHWVLMMQWIFRECITI